jgi:hypothetical protein
MVVTPMPPPNKRLQRTVGDKVPKLKRGRPAADAGRYTGADAVPGRLPRGAIDLRLPLIL